MYSGEFKTSLIGSKQISEMGGLRPIVKNIAITQR